MNKYNYDVNATISVKDTNVPQFTANPQKESLKFIENYDILLAQEKKQNELLEKKQQKPKLTDTNVLIAEASTASRSSQDSQSVDV